MQLEKFWRKEGALADKQRAGTTALEETQTAAGAESAADFRLNHRPSSHSPVHWSPDRRAAGPPARQLSAREKRGDRSRAGAATREVKAAGRCEKMMIRGWKAGCSAQRS